MSFFFSYMRVLTATRCKFYTAVIYASTQQQRTRTYFAHTHTHTYAHTIPQVHAYSYTNTYAYIPRRELPGLSFGRTPLGQAGLATQAVG